MPLLVNKIIFFRILFSLLCHGICGDNIKTCKCVSMRGKSRFLGEIKETRSIFSCFSKCQQDKYCDVFVYDKRRRVCRANREDAVTGGTGTQWTRCPCIAKREIRYKVMVKTGEQVSASTKANVFIRFLGSEGETKKIQLSNENDAFETGMYDHFERRGLDVGTLSGITVGHDNTGQYATWFLEYVRIKRFLSKSEQVKRLEMAKQILKERSETSLKEKTDNVDDKNEGGERSRDEIFASDLLTGDSPLLVLFEYDEYLFECQCWIPDKESGLKERHLHVTRKETMNDGEETRYQVTIHTGNVMSAATKANVFVQFVGTRGRTKKIFIDNPKKTFFGKGKIDQIELKGDDVGALTAINIGHDNSGFYAAWYLEDVKVKRYLSKTEQAEWLVKLKRGENRPKEDEQKNKDERIDGRPKEVFAKNGMVLKIPDFEEYFFTCKCWLAADGKMKLNKELQATKLELEFKVGEIPYRVQLHTGDGDEDGTDANVFIQFVGTNGKTRKITLDDSANNFEPGVIETFKLEEKDVGPLKSIIIGHDNDGSGSDWFLVQVKITRFLSKVEQIQVLEKLEENASKEETSSDGGYQKALRSHEYEIYTFDCKGWLSKSKGERKLVKELNFTSKVTGDRVRYEVTVQTGKQQEAATDAHVYIQLYGNSGTSRPIYLENPWANFEKGKTDNFRFKVIGVGPLTRIRVGHDNKGFRNSPDWYLEDVSVRQYLTKDEQHRRRISKKQHHASKNKKGKEITVPEYEEHYFKCNCWIPVPMTNKLSKELTVADGVQNAKKKQPLDNFFGALGLFGNDWNFLEKEEHNSFDYFDSILDMFH